MSTSQFLRVLVLSAAAAVTCSASSITAADYTGGAIPSAFGSATGYYFTPTTDITVLQLGFYDLTGTGLNGSHNVGIFLTNGTVVVNALIGAGTTAPLIAGTVGGTRVADVTPTLLTSGTGYYINGDNFTVDPYVFGPEVTFAAAIVWDGYSAGASNSIFSSTFNGGGQPGDLGPNFTYVLGDASGIPEPSSVLLCASGLAALYFRRYRRS